MEIEFQKSANNKFVLPWLATTAVTLVIIFIFHLVVYYLFYTDTKTLTQHFIDVIPIYFYALIWPMIIVNSYKSTILKVKHNGEVDPVLVKDYFQQKRYTLIGEKFGHYKLESQKKLDKLFPGSRHVEIDFTDTEISITMPFNLRYPVHHSFKFLDIFIKK